MDGQLVLFVYTMTQKQINNSKEITNKSSLGQQTWPHPAILFDVEILRVTITGSKSSESAFV